MDSEQWSLKKICEYLKETIEGPCFEIEKSWPRGLPQEAAQWFLDTHLAEEGERAGLLDEIAVLINDGSVTEYVVSEYRGLTKCRLEIEHTIDNEYQGVDTIIASDRSELRAMRLAIDKAYARFRNRRLEVEEDAERWRAVCDSIYRPIAEEFFGKSPWQHVKEFFGWRS